MTEIPEEQRRLEGTGVSYTPEFYDIEDIPDLSLWLFYPGIDDQYIYINPGNLSDIVVQDGSGRLFKRPLIDRV
jgi:hypothetical protein